MDSSSRWVFGYGSLVWRPAFDHEERVPAYIRGYARRFWQASPDHRGVPEAPGRVVTIVPEADAVCWGTAYRVAGTKWAEVVDALDERESGGFERLDLELGFADAGRAPQHALVYIAGEGNPNFIGPAPLEAMAAQVRSAAGKSGSNVEYVVRLHDALLELGERDHHVEALALAVAPTDGR